MTHAEVEANAIVDRYVRRELNEVEQHAFEEHFFGCDVCFDEVEQVTRLQGAVRASAREKWFEASTTAPHAVTAPAESRTLAPARSFAVAQWSGWAVAATLALTVGWLTLVRMPALRDDVRTLSHADREEPVARPAQTPDVRPAPATIGVNVPLAVLTAERSGSTASLLAVPADVVNVVLWVDAPQSPSGKARITMSASTETIIDVTGLVRNSNGAYVVTIPAGLLRASEYRILLSDAVGGASLGDFRLRISR